ncbi:MAG TPA: hypothetical protein VFS21_01500 [Roseiflexaceae bacterium]|nr:hypothetical protein [Roseiflexaceae bacterium]
MSNLEAAFHQEMLDSYHQLAEQGYRATYFLRMIQQHGGLQAARQLIAQEGTSEGLHRIWDLKRLDLSAEALALKPEFRSLFSDEERQRARQHLADLHYRAPWDAQD